MKDMKFYLWALLYKVLLEIVYIEIVSPTYHAYGLVWTPNYDYFIVSYFLFFFLLLMIPKGQVKPSHQLSQLLFFTTGVPLLSIFWQIDQGLTFVLYVTVCFMLFFVMLRYIKGIRIPYLMTAKKGRSLDSFAEIVLILAVLFAAVFTVKYGGIDPRAFSFETVYDLRGDRSITGIWAYLLNWTTKLLVPFALVIFYFQKRWVLYISSCLVQTFFYLGTGSKSILFSVVLITGCAYLLKNNKWKIGLTKMYSFIILGASVFYLITDYLMAVALFPTRQLIQPAQIGIGHYNFFVDNPKLYLSEGMLGKILGLESPYSITSTFLVSPIAGVNWNTGFFGDAYDNGGFFFMVIYTIILGFILLMIDSVSSKSTERYKYTALSVYSIIILNDGSLLTTLFTWGFGFLLFFMYITASQEVEKQIMNQSTGT